MLKNSKMIGISLFVYNRPWHTLKVLEGLKKNQIKKLYIFSDGPKNEKDISQVKKVRELIKKIKWCNVEIIKRKKNIGLANSIINGVNLLFEKYEKAIILEDDCVPATDFINYMEKCLNKYEDYQNVMSVTGFNKIKIPKYYSYDIYFFRRNSSWGWGTWLNSWAKFNSKLNDYNYFINDKKAQNEFNKGGEDLVDMLRKQVEGKIDSWSIKWTYAHYKNNGYCVYPVKNKICNIGFDGSGANCKKSERYKTKISVDNYKKETLELPNEVFVDPIINKRFKKLYKKSLISKMKRKLKNLV